MRKLFFFCSILAINICLAEKWWEDKFIIGAHWGPPLQYNEDNILTRDFTLLQGGGFNFMLGIFNPHNNYTDTLLKYHLDSLIDECRTVCEQNELYFLNQCGDPDTVYGLNIKDEPEKEQALEFLLKIDSLKQLDHNPALLGFLNLFPSHHFNSFNDWEDYVDAYLGDTTLQLACFENYNPHSNFKKDHPDSVKNYYANLAYMKQAAGSRPLWAYLRCSGKFVEEKDTAWQDAFIRLGAFAPLAFGAKGIIYFTYDCQDRNRIRRAPDRGAWADHDMYFDNDEDSRQIFFGNFKYNNNNVPDLAIHTNDSTGTWYIKESRNSWKEDDSNPMIKIGTWFGDHINNMPNIYNWDFASDGRDKFTTITRDGRLLLSRFRSGWTHKAIITIPWDCWSSMTRHTCPFADFNENHDLDLCLGWTENGHGKLRICMDCQENAVQDPSTTITDMSFANTSQVFTFSDSIKQVFTRNDSIWVITSNPSRSHATSDSLFMLKFNGTQFDTIYPPHQINLSKKIEHYWMEDSLYGQDNNGNVWGEVYGQAYNMTRMLKNYSSRELYVWGQYNNWTHKYDRYSIAPEVRSGGYQSYAQLDRKGNPTRIYQTARTINQFINESIRPIISNGVWQDAYFSYAPNQSELNLLKVLKGEESYPCSLLPRGFAMSSGILFGLYKKKQVNDLDLLVINMREIPQDLTFTIDNIFESNTYQYNNITRIHPAENSHQSVFTHYTTFWLYNMLGGECAILHLTNTSNP